MRTVAVVGGGVWQVLLEASGSSTGSEMTVRVSRVSLLCDFVLFVIGYLKLQMFFGSVGATHCKHLEKLWELSTQLKC